MQKRTLKVALLAVLSFVLVLGIGTGVFAASAWSDLPDTVTAKYGITDNQVAGISEGFAGGLWKPYQSITRAQFTKMAVAAFNIPLADPATASFTDVPKGSFYYPYVEGAKAKGIVNGTSATTFGLNTNITRQQAIAIVARYVASAQGYDLATMYTADEIDHLLAHFGDAASVSADLKDEVAFAFDMGLTTGDDYGNVNPLANLTRIQAAAFLIRAQGLVPPKLYIPAKIELISADKTEGLIGQTYSVTFEVTDAAGHPAIGVLVDLDTLLANDFYVGNVSPQAAVTNNYGQVTVNMLSLEPGTQRLSATVAGVGTIYVTRYWLVLDEVYSTKGQTAQNNAGVEHTWQVRVVVFGPGPRSTSQDDWYNAIDAAFDPTNINVYDGVDYDGDNWDASIEKAMAIDPFGPFTPRTMAGIDVEWAIYDYLGLPVATDDIISVGNIIKVDGNAITPAKTAVGKTDANGLSSIVVYSEKTGKTLTEAVADYPQNPYPEQLFNHSTFTDYEGHYLDWDDQPTDYATQTKTWISHTIGTEAGPISAAYDSANIGEELTLTITLVDVYGNPVQGKSVEWFMQGVGFFQTDDSGDTSDPKVAANNKDFDVTNAAGVAKLYVKSYEAGEQIVHAKVRDKGTGGAEGTYVTYTAEVQWFDANVATFDDITTTGQYVADPKTGLKTLWDPQNEAVSKNPVNTTHDFCVWVYGLKLEYDPTIDDPDGQTRYIDTDAAGSSYDGVFDAKDAAYLGGILLVNPWDLAEYREGTFEGGYLTAINLVTFGSGYTEQPTVAISAPDMIWGVPATAHAVVIAGSVAAIIIDNDGSGYSSAPTVTVNGGGAAVTPATATATIAPLVKVGEGWFYRDGVVVDEVTGMVLKNTNPQVVKVAGRDIKLSLVGGYTRFDWDGDGYKEYFEANDLLDLIFSPPLTGIYLPLAGKTATFTKETGTVGTFTPAKATTDAAGKACMTVSSTAKGPQVVQASIDWPGNPHNGPELLSAYATKTWVSGTVAAASDVTIEVYIDDVLVATNEDGELDEGSSPMWTVDPVTGEWVLNSADVAVHVLDAYGNDLADYEVVYLLENIDGWLYGSQNATDTRIPFAYLYDEYPDLLKDADGNLVNYDQNGPLPDADEPIPASDPYAYIVGEGGTDAFYFNQWLGSDKAHYPDGQPGLPKWWTRVSGMGFDGYYADPEHAWYNYTWPSPWPSAGLLFDGFDGVFDGMYDPAYDIELATDGAKAWTLDGWMLQGRQEPIGVELVPNLLTGSHISIQLAEATFFTALHYKSILRVMVYAPGDGVIKEGDYLWSTQVHQEWQVPVPTTVTFDKTEDYKIAGLESETAYVTVKDQYGRPYPGVAVDFSFANLEGGFTAEPTTTPVITGPAGNASYTWSKNLGDWGVEKVTATVLPGLFPAVSTKASALIQWIKLDGVTWTDDTTTTFDESTWPADMIMAPHSLQALVVYGGLNAWDGKTLQVWANPGGNALNMLGSKAYDWLNAETWISTNTGTWFDYDLGVFVKGDAINTNHVPNWIFDWPDLD